MEIISTKRIESIDLLKGLVMVIMALDHVRDYFHYPAFFFSPTDPEHSTLPIFFTRFITNFCAPAFSFLAGLSAFMVGRRKGRNELSRFLLKRGLWLVFVELVIAEFAWHFDIYFRDNVFQVIWVLGISMIILAALIHLPGRYLLPLSCIIILGHNLLDPVHFNNSVLWSFIHERKQYDITPAYHIVIAYPIIPWFAVMSLGYCFGSFYDKSFDPDRRRKMLNLAGFACLVVFLVLRITNIYGNLLPWRSYGHFSQTLISFLSVTKYPPSLDFLLITLGSSFLFLAYFENAKGRIVDFFCVFGRVPFFYYIIHIFIIHLAALLMAQLTGFGWQKMILTTMPSRAVALRGFGYNLITVYLIWIALIAILYPICRRFDRYKQNNKGRWWLSYF